MGNVLKILIRKTVVKRLVRRFFLKGLRKTTKISVRIAGLRAEI
jgi:hypothetical protein